MRYQYPEVSWSVAFGDFMLLAAVGAVVLYYAIVEVRRSNAEERWKQRGRYCIKCGYSLKGNQSGVCPECGEPIQI